MSNRCLVVIIVVCFVVVNGCATYRMHPDFKERQKQIRSFSIMSPGVEIYKLTFKGEQIMMYDLIEQVTQTTTDEIKHIFQDKGYQYRELDLSDEELQRNPGVKASLYSVNTLFDKTLADISLRKSKKFEYSLGADVNPFTDISGSDILIFVREEGFKKTGGEIAKDFLKSLLIGVGTFGTVVPMYAYSATAIQVAVVDGDSGDVLWYHHNAGGRDLNASNQKTIRNSLKRTFKAFPKRDPLATGFATKVDSYIPPEPAYTYESLPLKESEVEFAPSSYAQSAEPEPSYVPDETSYEVPSYESAPVVVQEEYSYQEPVIEPAPPVYESSAVEEARSDVDYQQQVRTSVTATLIKPETYEKGVVNVAITVDSDGSVKDIEFLEGSSHKASFRRAVKQAIYDAAPFPVRAGTRTVTMNVEF